MLSGNKTGVTYTILTLHTKLKDTGINLPLGKILSLCPFFITYATDKEISLCMCKVCLNKRPLHNVLLVQDKTDENDSNKLITHFFMQRCDYPKSPNVYYRWKCVSNKCKDWKSLKQKVRQFELRKHHVRKPIKLVKLLERFPWKQKTVVELKSFKELYNSLVSLKKSYFTKFKCRMTSFTGRRF